MVLGSERELREKPEREGLWRIQPLRECPPVGYEQIIGGRPAELGHQRFQLWTRRGTIFFQLSNLSDLC